MLLLFYTELNTENMTIYSVNSWMLRYSFFFFLQKQGTEEMGQKMNKEASNGKEEKPAKKTIASKL